MKHFKVWANHDYPLPVIVFIMLCAGGLFVVLIPWTLVILLPRLDERLGLPPISFGTINIITGCILIAVGLFFAWGAIGAQIFIAKGTPVPLVPTHQLLVSGVFKYCRNPMIFGTLCAYTGIAILAGTISGIICIFIFAALLIVYVKLVEERELEMRFGQEYLDYKARTPFIIPRVFSEKAKK